MATIKSYTDINQSKKLAEILPLESADMYYDDIIDCVTGELFIPDNGSTIMVGKGLSSSIAAWSLAALLATLPNEIITDNRFECHYQIDIRKYDWYDNATLYQIAYGNNRGLSGSWHDMVNTGEKENLIDCCVQMIINLHEQKLL